MISFEVKTQDVSIQAIKVPFFEKSQISPCNIFFSPCLLLRVSESMLAGVDSPLLRVSESMLAGVDGILLRVSESMLTGVDSLLFSVAILQFLQDQVVLASLGYPLCDMHVR